jgi:hypothetical protein
MTWFDSQVIVDWRKCRSASETLTLAKWYMDTWHIPEFLRDTEINNEGGVPQIAKTQNNILGFNVTVNITVRVNIFETWELGKGVSDLYMQPTHQLTSWSPRFMTVSRLNLRLCKRKRLCRDGPRRSRTRAWYVDSLPNQRARGIPTPPSRCFKMLYSHCTEDEWVMGSSLTATASSFMIFCAWYTTANGVQMSKSTCSQ